MIMVDTTVIIDLWRGREGIKEYLAKKRGESFFISAITIAEIYDGLGYTKEKKGKEVYINIKEQYELLLNDFHIVPLTLEIIKKAGIFRGKLRAKGIIIDLADIIIMITSQSIKAKKIITRNPDHFDESPIQVESYEIT